MNKRLVSIQVVGALSVFLVGACSDNRMTDPKEDMGAHGAQGTQGGQDHAAGSGMMGMMGMTGMTGMSHENMMKMGDTAMMDSAMAAECQKMKETGVHHDHP